MQDDLPEFDRRPMHRVMPFARSVFGPHLVEIITYESGYYRLIFQSAYFVLQGGHSEPSKSQWTTLKKKMKRRDRLVFVLKQHGEIECRASGQQAHSRRANCYYIDFGFFLSE